MNHYLEIAGTSSGGSSYTVRVMQELGKCAPADVVVIVIGQGPKQVEVYRLVANQVLALHSFVAMQEGCIKTKIKVVMG